MTTRSRGLSPFVRTRVGALLAAACLSLPSCADDDEEPASEQIVGTWQPKEVSGTELASSFDTASAQVTLNEDGKWEGSDGCNDLQGEYTITDDGDFVSSGDPVVGVGCDGGQVSYESLFAQTDKVEFTADGKAVFKASSGDRVLVLEPVE